MAVNLQAILDAPIIELDDIDSTNNYAMRLIDADTAQEGLTVVAGRQTQGKGQRGNQWVDSPNESLLMSIIIHPGYRLTEQFLYNASVTVAIATVLQNLCESVDVRIKWPNDIILNDKKAGGVLIENVLRGTNWHYSIVGLGLNVLQQQVPTDLPNATSVFRASGQVFDLAELGRKIRAAILAAVAEPKPVRDIMKEYNDFLFRRFEIQAFTDGASVWDATVLQAKPNGELEVQLSDGRIANYAHGVVKWKW